VESRWDHGWECGWRDWIAREIVCVELWVESMPVGGELECLQKAEFEYAARRKADGDNGFMSQFAFSQLALGEARE